MRCTAILAQHDLLKRGEGDWPLFTRLVDAMLDDKEFFVRKAIGWVLRETSKKRPKLVSDCLLPRRERVSGLTLREGAKYLSDAQRRRLGLAPWRDHDGAAYPRQTRLSPTRRDERSAPSLTGEASGRSVKRP